MVSKPFNEEIVCTTDSSFALLRPQQITTPLTSSTCTPACSTSNIPTSEPRPQFLKSNLSTETNQQMFTTGLMRITNNAVNNNINEPVHDVTLSSPICTSDSTSPDAIIHKLETSNAHIKKKSYSSDSSVNGSLLANNYQSLVANNAILQKGTNGEAPYSTIGTSMNDRRISDDSSLGPLPPKWECAYTERGELYFIDHNTGTSHWLDPRLSKFQKKTLEDCSDNELPYGWEKIDDALYGTYYIDHVNRRTQYENPVLEAKRRIADQKEKTKHMHKAESQGEIANNVSPLTLPYKFTKNPDEMLGERITTTLLKSSRGLGITIIGGDDNVEEFLQIKSIVPNGPAWLDGRLKTGDILVYVNDTCVLGFTHHEMVNVFQSILPGETVTFEVCRGYPLPFDPNDPNTEVVTTIAVDGINSNLDKEHILLNLSMDRNYNFAQPNNSTDTLPDTTQLNETTNSFIENETTKMEVLTLSIAKGNMGFGFTIADSVRGQKVKKILDKKSCKNLQEGDILLEINDIPVNQMSHCEVVRTLKECPKSGSAIVKIQRVADVFSSKKDGRDEDQWTHGRNPSIDRFFRSKTPTADIYSTQPKEILPARPKTPVIDTRKNYIKANSNEFRKREEIDFKNTDKQNEVQKTPSAKSLNSLQDVETISNDIHYMDPYQEIETNLSNRLTITSVNEHCNSSNMDVNPFIFSDFGYNSIYDGGFAQQESEDNILIQSHAERGNNFYLPLVGSITTTPHQETCYCHECQNNQRHKYYQPSQASLGVQINQNAYLDKNTRKVYESNVELQQHQSNLAHAQVFNCSLPVTLERQSQGFGFRIVGGTEEGSQVTIGHVVPGGAADGNTGIATGDEILSIDGVSVINSSHHKVVSLMGESASRGQVTMILRRRLKQINSSIINRTIPYPYDVVLNRNESEGFGFVIISSSNQLYGSTIGKLIPGSPADRCGEIKVGDHIIAVNRIDIAGMTHGNVVNLIKESGLQVRLTIGLPKEETFSLNMQGASQFMSESSAQCPPL